MEAVPLDAEEVGEGAIELMAKPAVEIGFKLEIRVADGRKNFSQMNGDTVKYCR